MEMRKKQLQNKSAVQKDRFFITLPNTALPGIELQQDGWFTYAYKYGRKANEKKDFVRFVPFDRKNVSAATYERLQLALPHVYERIF